jgi:hypothetical protein
MSRLIHAFVLTTALLAATGVQAQGVALEKALQHVPSTANSLAIVKIQELVNSPRGKQEQWAKKHQSEFLAGAVHVPPSVDFLVRAFEFHPEDSRVTNAYGIASWKKPVTMSSLAEHERGRIQMVAGHPAVLTGRNTYFAELSPGLVGVVSPGYRQDLARWLRGLDKGPENPLSPYLQDVVARSGSAPVVLALDFQDLVDPLSWRSRIKSSTAVIDKPNAVKLLADLADSLRGVTLQIQVAEKTTATIFLDFNTAVSQLAKPFLKPVLIDLLQEAGASLDDLENGEVAIDGKTAAITFDLSDAGLRHVMSMILMPSPAESASDAPPPPAAGDSPSTTPAANESQAKLSSSRNYYTAVNQILDDLEAMSKKSVNYNRTAVWHENYAKKIDELPIRGVDPDLLTWATSVSSNLRALAVSLRGVPITVNMLQGGLSYNVQYQPAGYRSSNYSIWGTVAWQPEYVNVETNQSQIRAQQAQAIAAGAMQREQVWQLLLSDRQQIRIKMQSKFGRDFSAPRP